MFRTFPCLFKNCLPCFHSPLIRNLSLKATSNQEKKIFSSISSLNRNIVFSKIKFNNLVITRRWKTKQVTGYSKNPRSSPGKRLGLKKFEGV
jgi:hypothetical protein